MSKRVFDEGLKLRDNAMLKHRKELFYQWHFENNDGLGLDVYKIYGNSSKIAWWICPDCMSFYDMKVRLRTGNLKMNGRNCPYCAGKRINHTNSLSSLFPELSTQWHPTKNGKLTPHDRAAKSRQKAWWLSKECGHWWEATINNRTQGKNCPYCSGRKAWKGETDMATTNPELAKLLLNSEDGYKYMQGSGRKLDWKCPDCKNVIKNKNISDVRNKGLSCPKCSDGIKFPEKFMYNLLKEATIEFVFDAEQEWIKGKRYDFYLPKYNWIIEVHGGQHYEDGFETLGGRTTKEEQKNDRLKHDLAKENGIDKYIVIDARHSTVEWIKNSILSSEIMSIIDEIDFEKIGQLTSKTLIKEVCDIWMIDIQSTLEIAKITRLSQGTIRKYLKRGAEIGWCDYDSGDEMKKRSSRAKEEYGVPVVQLSIDGEYINAWISGSEAGRQLSIAPSSISIVCSGKRKSAGDFRWMYSEDYEKVRNKIESGEFTFEKSTYKTKVVQLDKDFNLIKIWNSGAEAATTLNISNDISRSCKNMKRTAGGFKWMYVDDYEELCYINEMSKSHEDAVDPSCEPHECSTDMTVNVDMDDVMNYLTEDEVASVGFNTSIECYQVPAHYLIKKDYKGEPFILCSIEH